MTAEGVPIGLAILDYAKEPQPAVEQPNWETGIVESVELVDGDETGSHSEGSSVVTAAKSLGMTQKPTTSKVFLVHGRDAGAMHEVARFLERLGIEVTILHERPNKGRTLISKFEEESADISYAVVLMTPDDMGNLKGGNPTDRARQNVVFELGFFIGRLGASNVRALVSRGVDRPSDFESVVCVEYDGGKWKTELPRELRAAGMPFDHSKVF